MRAWRHKRDQLQRGHVGLREGRGVGRGALSSPVCPLGSIGFLNSFSTCVDSASARQPSGREFCSKDHFFFLSSFIDTSDTSCRYICYQNEHKKNARELQQKEAPGDERGGTEPLPHNAPSKSRW